MSNYVYNDEFATITGTIFGSDFDTQYKALEIAVNSKADLAGPVAHTGTHTIATLVVTGTTTLDDLTVNGTASLDGGTWA